jgi:hypothetical protein
MAGSVAGHDVLDDRVKEAVIWAVGIRHCDTEKKN